MDHKKYIAEVIKKEKQFSARDHQAIRYVFGIDDKKLSGVFHSMVTKNSVPRETAFRFIDEVLAICGISDQPDKPVVFSTTYSITDAENIQERCLHVKILSELLKNGTFDDFHHMMDDNGIVGDLRNDPYNLFRELDRRNELSLEKIKETLDTMSEQKIVSDLVEKYKAAVEQENSSASGACGQGSGLSHTSAPDNPTSIGSLSINLPASNVSGNVITNIIVGPNQGTVSTIGNPPNAQTFSQPTETVKPTSPAKKQYSFPKQESRDDDDSSRGNN